MAGKRGRPRRHPPPPPSTVFSPPPPPVTVGNCSVEVEGTCEFQDDGRFLISTSGAATTPGRDSGACMAQRSSGNPSALFETNDRGPGSYILKDHSFVILNPKESNISNKLLIQEVLQLYKEELPSMNYAANTGKQTSFLEKCVSGKYRTMALRTNTVIGHGEVVAAISFQLIPADTQYAEIPLAAVSSKYQGKGIGYLVYSELRSRLQRVGTLSIFCWADKESTGFWLKQGFASIGDVDGKGRAHKLRVRADIRKSLCFPGGSTLMVSHLIKEAILPTKYTEKSDNAMEKVAARAEHLISADKDNGFHQFSVNLLGCTNVVSGLADSAECNGEGCCNAFQKATKRGAWQASLPSLKSKRVKSGSHCRNCSMVFGCTSLGEDDRGKNVGFDDLSLDACECKFLADFVPGNVYPVSTVHAKEDAAVEGYVNERCIANDLLASRIDHVIMFMNIADENKRACLMKIVEQLGGSVTSDGRLCTHVITGKARKTLNFCTALCSGAWIVSSSWLKESCREGKFIEESEFILEDADYALKYKSSIKDAVMKAKAKPQSLLKGYSCCIARHIQPPANILSILVKSAGGNVIDKLDDLLEPSRTIFLACEEDMEDAMLAAKKGICTYSSDWFIYCIMRQDLDFDAPQFAESL